MFSILFYDNQKLYDGKWKWSKVFFIKIGSNFTHEFQPVIKIFWARQKIECRQETALNDSDISWQSNSLHISRANYIQSDSSSLTHSPEESASFTTIDLSIHLDANLVWQYIFKMYNECSMPNVWIINMISH